jgi:hypothetical protein
MLRNSNLGSSHSRRIQTLSAITVLLGCLLSAGSCRQEETRAESPTEAYKRLYTAVKSKDIEAIKKNLTRKTIEFGVFAAARNKVPPEKMYENGFTATTFAPELPEIRDERINGDHGAVEVWNAKESRWEDLPFIREDGAWKLATGELFAGTFQQPGLGRDLRERIAANMALNANQPPDTDINRAPSKRSNSKSRP